MLDIGWSELLLIGIVALIVIGPEDLPRMFRALGRITARARGMAREFSAAMDDAARSSGIDDAANSLRDVKAMTSKKALGLDALDRAAERFEKWEPKMPRREAGLQPDPADPSVPDAAAPAIAPASALAATRNPGPAATTEDDGQAPGAATNDTADVAAESGRRRLHAVRRSEPRDL
ncbi:Sec-independent protein translocase protein TatB [uncultured Paracoccus sp.]|uniref:Sec-independent protein translocase protein TatB n=1 Tax=uncultured Paracoccus sp. TaxID=189685 RepID=UPI002622542D|nr:Sec-independent protein translocase protein TatB [uncultured Paracoccus sp.]